MTDQFLRRVIKKLSVLEEREAALVAELDVITHERASYQAAREVYEREMEGQLPKRSKRSGRRVKKTIADAAETVLKQEDKPMGISDLVERLRSQGDAKGKNVYSTVTKTLLRDPLRFNKVGRGLWQLTQPVRPSSNGASSPVEALDMERSQVD